MFLALLFLSITQHFFDHFIIAVACIVFHVVPEIHSYTLVALLEMVVPKRGQIEHVSSIDSYFIHICILILGIGFQIWLQRVQIGPFNHYRFVTVCNRKDFFNREIQTFKFSAVIKLKIRH